MKIGILTYHASINYGAYLQAFSLQQYLTNALGSSHSIEIIDYECCSSHALYLHTASQNEDAYHQYHKFLSSHRQLKLSSLSLITDSLADIMRFLQDLHYDIIIAGSDEIWRTDSVRGFPNAYWLNFDTRVAPVYMSYAASGRNDYQKLSDEHKDYIYRSLSGFEYIGVRDRITQKELHAFTDKKIHLNCDPVLLIPEYFQIHRKKKAEIRKQIGIQEDKPVIVVMTVTYELCIRLSRLLQNDHQVICLYNPCYLPFVNNQIAISPFEWSKIIACADFVVTEFFHATLFSIVHNVPFISIECRAKGRGKIENLLLEYNLPHHLIYHEDYHGNFRQLSLDAYTMIRHTLRDYYPQIPFDSIIASEKKKVDSFFSHLKRNYSQET